MKIKKLRSNKEVSVNITKFKIDWDKKISKPQKQVKDFLYPDWRYDLVLEEFLIPGSKLRFDLVNITKKICVEVSPRQHFKFNEFLHKNESNFLESIKRDDNKRNWCIQNEYRFVEITEEELKDLKQEHFE